MEIFEKESTLNKMNVIVLSKIILSDEIKNYDKGRTYNTNGKCTKF